MHPKLINVYFNRKREMDSRYEKLINSKKIRHENENTDNESTS